MFGRMHGGEIFLGGEGGGLYVRDGAVSRCVKGGCEACTGFGGWRW